MISGVGMRAVVYWAQGFQGAISPYLVSRLLFECRGANQNRFAGFMW